MTIDPYYAALRTAQAEADAHVRGLMMPPELLAKLAPQSVPDPTYVWRKGLRLGFENYMGCPAAEASVYAAPGVGDPAGLPPTLLIACEYDVLRASARVYAESLAEAGVRHKLVLYPGVGHGHTVAPWLPAAQQTYEDMAAWLADA
jgi:acetyl esterase/lipase